MTSISDAGADLGLVSRALPDEERAADVELVVHEEALGVRPRDVSEVPSENAIGVTKRLQGIALTTAK